MQSENPYPATHLIFPLDSGTASVTTSLPLLPILTSVTGQTHSAVACYASSGTGSTCSSDAMSYAATKFSVPTVANGFVYVGTQGSATVNNGNAGMFYIFGSNRTC